MTVSRTLTLTALVVTLAQPAFAQKLPAPTSPEAAQLRAQVRTMERVFSSAIQNGVDEIARKMNAVMPGVRLFAGMPHAHGYQVENFGWFFDVEVPLVQEAIVDLYSDLYVPRPASPTQPQTRVGNRGTVTPATPDATILEDPQGEYRKAMRSALIDAMLDFGQLPLKPNEELTVGARGADSPAADTDSTVALILRITGSDLTAFRQGKITRAEAKARIKIHEYER